MSGAAAGFGWSVTQVAIGWITLAASDSILAVGATFALRLVPSLLLGIPLGGLVDRHDRRATLILVHLATIVPLLWVALVAANGTLAVSQLLLLSLALGVADTLRGTATQTYSFDLVGAAGATNALALVNLGVFMAGAVGSVAGGVALERMGVASPFVLSAALAASAALFLVLGGARARRERPAPHLVPSFSRSMTLITRNRRVALIALVVVMAEVFGFSSLTVFPTFARDVFDSDAAGLGALGTARYIGSIAVLLFLARVGLARSRGGRALILAVCATGPGPDGVRPELVIRPLAGRARAGGRGDGRRRYAEPVTAPAERGRCRARIGLGDLVLRDRVRSAGSGRPGCGCERDRAPAALAVSGAVLALFAIALARFRAIHELV